LREEALIANMKERIEAHEQALLERVPENRRDEKMREYAETRAVIQATLERTEKIIDDLEVDLKQRCPQVFHLTVEVEGIAAPKEPDEPDAIAS
jgi:zinc transporter 9